jgi:hypothetical protein
MWSDKMKICFTTYLSIVILLFVYPLFSQSAKVSSGIYLTGEGFAEKTGSPDDIVIAKERAMSDLANQIQASVKSEFVTELTEASNTISEYAKSKVNVISEMQIEGVRWNVDEEGDFVKAQALLNKLDATDLYFERTKELSEKINQTMNRISGLMSQNNNERALRDLFEVSKLFSQFEQNVLIYMILGGREQDQLKPSFSRSELDDKIFKLTESDFKSFDDAINGLCFQISKQVPTGKQIVVFPFDYQDTSFGSELSDYIRQQILFNLPKFLKFQEGKIDPDKNRVMGYKLSGNYWVRQNNMELLLAIYDENGTTIGSAKVTFPVSYVNPLGIAYQPQNFTEAMSEDKLFAKNEVVYGDLNIDFWTNKGDHNLIFHNGEEMRLYVRVNTPSYIRFIYHLANGMRTPLYKNYYIDERNVNKPVELPDVFECAPPFGVEKLQIFVSTEELPMLDTRKTKIDGEEYEVLAEDLGEFLAKTRGFIRKKPENAKTAERVITLTTVNK